MSSRDLEHCYKKADLDDRDAMYSQRNCTLEKGAKNIFVSSPHVWKRVQWEQERPKTFSTTLSGEIWRFISSSKVKNFYLAWMLSWKSESSAVSTKDNSCITFLDASLWNVSFTVYISKSECNDEDGSFNVWSVSHYLMLYCTTPHYLIRPHNWMTTSPYKRPIAHPFYASLPCNYMHRCYQFHSTTPRVQPIASSPR